MHKILFFNKFIIFLYMFRALCAHHQEVKIVLHSIWYHHTETSEWSKITEIQFYKYEHIVVKFMYEFFRCDCCILLTINTLCHGDVTFIQLLNLLKWYYVYCSTCFGWFLHPSSGTQITVSTASGTGQQLLLPVGMVGGVQQ